MNLHTYIRHLYIFALVLAKMTLQAECIQEWEALPPLATLKYTLVDLGEANMPLENLSKQALPNSFSPLINNLRQIVCNRGDRGYILDMNGGEISPQVSTITSYCHGINDFGELLLAFERSPNDLYWSIWKIKNLRKIDEITIDLQDLLGKNIYLRALGNNGMAVGAFKPEGKLRPLIWTKSSGLHHLGYQLGWDIEGVIWGVNDKNTVVGQIDNEELGLPFAWNSLWGLERLNDFAWHWKGATRCPLQQPIKFVDLVIANDDRVFGTFVDGEIYDGIFHYKAYWWDPKSKQIRPLELQGMRLSGVDSKYTLVGSLNGEAAACQRGAKPLLLKELIDEKAVSGWKLLDATDINDHGDIVGYGIHNDKIHYFLLKQER